MASVLSKEFFDIQATIECGFTLKLVHDMIRRCLDGSGLNDIFHLLVQRLALSGSLLSFCEVLIGS